VHIWRSFGYNTYTIKAIKTGGGHVLDQLKELLTGNLPINVTIERSVNFADEASSKNLIEFLEMPYYIL